MPHRTRLLFIGPLPEPVTGHSLACQVLLEALEPVCAVTVVNLSKASFRGGVTSFGRIGEVASILRQVRRAARTTDVVYFTISESVAGNVKDLLIYSLCWRSLARMVIHLHGGSIRTHLFDRHPLLRALNGFFLRRIGCVIVLGQTHLAVFEGLVAPSRLRVVANFAQDYLFTDAASISRKFSDTRTLHLLFLGNLIEGKGHADLLAGYQLLPAALQGRIRLHFAGAFDSAQDEADFRIAVAGDTRVSYHGVVHGAEKRALLDQAHVLVLPTTLSEGQPISILEAYAAGCVVMTTPCGGIPDVFTGGIHGYALRPNEPESVRNAVSEALANSDSLVHFAEHNWQEAGLAYRTAQYSERVAALIDEVKCGFPVPADPDS